MYSYDRRASTVDPEEFGRETARLLAEAAAPFMHRVLNKIMQEKQITRHNGFESMPLIQKLVQKRAEGYFVERTRQAWKGDRNAQSELLDVVEMNREIIEPTLKDLFNMDSKYTGFGPKSYLTRVQKLPESPPYEKVLKARYYEFRGLTPRVS